MGLILQSSLATVIDYKSHEPKRLVGDPLSTQVEEQALLKLRSLKSEENQTCAENNIN